MITVPLPERCLTLLPPWPQAIRYAGKRLENRSSGVGRSVSNWRYGLGLNNAPIIGLSQSKKCDVIKAREEASHFPCNRNMLTNLDVEDLGGKLWLCAELLDVLPPDRAAGDPWYVPGQWGLMLGRVWEVKPIACMGGQGMWRSQWCVACRKVIADSHGTTCKSCLSKLVAGQDRPQLEVVAEVLT